jgi:hypothetical protein
MTPSLASLAYDTLTGYVISTIWVVFDRRGLTADKPSMRTAP